MANLSAFFDEVKEKEKILFIDGHNLFYRLLYVSWNEYKVKHQDFIFGNISADFTIDDMYLYWKHLVLNSFFSLITKFNPERILFCCDSRHNWRKDVYDDYKGNRQKKRDDSEVDYEEFFKRLDEFILEAKELFSTVYFLKINNCETDDTIAVLAKKFSNNIAKEIIIVSSDKDFLQLQKYKNIKQYDGNQKKFISCLNPENELEIKILTGDKGDNIPAVRPRVGPVTASKLLNEGLDIILKDPLIAANYIRNKKLISFEEIPDDIINIIDTAFLEYELKPLNGLKILSYFLNNKLNKLQDELQIYLPFIKKLK